MSEKERKAHLDTLSNFAIIKHFDRNKTKHTHAQFGGVYANDELKDPKPNVVYILNLENAEDGGSHWTLLINGWYFDSFGAPPTQAISRFVKSYNPYQFQKMSGESCGYFATYVADNLLQGKPAIGDLIPDEVAHNERILKKYFI